MVIESPGFRRKREQAERELQDPTSETSRIERQVQEEERKGLIRVGRKGGGSSSVSGSAAPSVQTPIPSEAPAVPTATEESFQMSLPASVREQRVGFARKFVEGRAPEVTGAEKPSLSARLERRVRSTQAGRVLGAGEEGLVEFGQRSVEVPVTTVGAAGAGIIESVFSTVKNPKQALTDLLGAAKDPGGTATALREDIAGGFQSGAPVGAVSVGLGVGVPTRLPGVLGRISRARAVGKVSKEVVTAGKTTTQRSVLFEDLTTGQKIVKDVSKFESFAQVGKEKFRILGVGAKDILLKTKDDLAATKSTAVAAAIGSKNDIVGAIAERARGITKIKEGSSLGASTGLQAKKLFERGKNLASPEKFGAAKEAVAQRSLRVFERTKEIGKDFLGRPITETASASITGKIAKRFKPKPATRSLSVTKEVAQIERDAEKFQILRTNTVGGAGRVGEKARGDFVRKIIDSPPTPQRLLRSKRGEVGVVPTRTALKPSLKPLGTDKLGLVSTTGGDLARLGGELARDVVRQRFKPPKTRFGASAIIGTGAAREIKPVFAATVKQIPITITTTIPKIGLAVEPPRPVPRPSEALVPPTEITRLVPPTEITKLVPTLITRLVPTTGGPTFGIGGGVPPPPPPVVPGGFLFPPGGAFGGGRNAPSQSKRPSAFTPSLTAIVFDIRGKPLKGILTGVELRPLPKRKKKGRATGLLKLL